MYMYECTVRNTENLTFPKAAIKEYHGWLCGKLQAPEQQIMDLPCAEVYEADYRGFIVYVWMTSPHHIRCSKPFVVLLL